MEIAVNVKEILISNFTPSSADRLVYFKSLKDIKDLISYHHNVDDTVSTVDPVVIYISALICDGYGYIDNGEGSIFVYPLVCDSCKIPGIE